MDLDDAFEKLLEEANNEEKEKEEKKRKKKEKKEKKKEKKEKGKKRSRSKSPEPVKDEGKGKIIEIICNDRLGNKVRSKVHENDTVGRNDVVVFVVVVSAERME